MMSIAIRERWARLLVACFGAGLMFGPEPAAAAPVPMEGTEKNDGIDTEHLFGFTEGSDIGEPGEVEIESQSSGRLSRRGRSFVAGESLLQLKAPLSENVRIGPGLGLSFERAIGVPGLPNRSGASPDTVFVETRTRLLDRAVSPFGLTLEATPSYSNVDDTTGRRSPAYGAQIRLLADRELVPGLLFAAANVSLGQNGSLTGQSPDRRAGSDFEVSGALSYRVRPDVFAGAELRYAEAFGATGLRRFVGDALFLGPSLFVKTESSNFLSATWSMQVTGRAIGGPRGLDLTNFERHQLRLRFGHTF